MEIASFVTFLRTNVSYSCCHDTFRICNELKNERGLLKLILGKGKYERKGDGCLANPKSLRIFISVQDVSAHHPPQVTFLQGCLCSYEGYTA